MLWEEYGLQTGNHHYHAILKVGRQYRKRVDAAANFLRTKAQLDVKPHVEVCRSVEAALDYRLTKAKREAWQKWCAVEGGQPRFFRHDPNRWLEPKEVK